MQRDCCILNRVLHLFQVIELCTESEGNMIDRSKLEDLLKQRFFYDQAFSIYQGVAGLFDYGPMGCAMKANLLAAWRSFFVLEEQMLEVDSCMLTPEIVLKLVCFCTVLNMCAVTIISQLLFELDLRK